MTILVILVIRKYKISLYGTPVAIFDYKESYADVVLVLVLYSTKSFYPFH